jgi:glycosyltransferase involved in cell wall biosynthesis
MKICFFVNSSGNFNPNAGGVQRITRVLVDEFQKIGIEALLLSMPDTKNTINYEPNEFCLPSGNLNSQENITFIKDIINQEKIEILINQFGIEPDSIKFIETIKKHVKIISAHHNCISCLYYRYPEIFKDNRGPVFVKLINDLRLWGLVKYLFRLRQKFIWRKMIKNSDAIVLYFDSFEKELLDLTGISSKKTHIISNPSPFTPKLRTESLINKRIVYVGRISEGQKRIDILMELWKLLHDRFKNWSFDMVGEGPYLETAKLFAKKNGLNRINFHGMRDPLTFWDESDIFTLTSDFEGYGMVLIEAQSRGTVPVTFNCYSAISEVVENNKSGIILKENTVDEAFETIKNLIDNEDEILRMRKEGVLQVEKYDKQLIAKQWFNLFKKITEI